MTIFRRKKKPDNLPEKLTKVDKPKGKWLNKIAKKTVAADPKGRFIANQHIARHMIRCFGWRPWMEDFVDQDGNNLPFPRGS